MQKATQLTLDGSEEAPALDSGGFDEFMRVSGQEGGLFLPAQAALALDRSAARIQQFMDAGQLRTWTFFGKRYVSCLDVAARRDADIKWGRPRRSTMEKIKVGAKILARTNRVQLLSGALGK